MLLLVAVTAVLPTNAVYNNNDIKSIVKNVVENNPLFANFPKPPDYPTGKQFAVLILISQQDYANGNTNIQLYPAPTWRNINNRYPVQPGPRVSVNYMVTRPDTPNEAGQRRRQHAEKKLLDNSGQLLQTFENQFGRPAMALLYTWATPCPRCTKALLAAKRLLDRKYPQAKVPISVVYSTDPKWQNSGMTTSINVQNRQNLRNAGFIVIDMNGPSYGGQGGGGSGGGGGRSGGGIGSRWPWPGSGGGGQFFSPTSPLLRPRFNMNSYLSGSSYWNRLRNQRRLGQGGLGYTQPSTTNFRRFGTGSQTNGWGLLRNRFPQRPPTNTGGRIANLLPALKWARPPPG